MSLKQIFCAAFAALVSISVFAVQNPFVKGEVYKWRTGINQCGTMRVIESSGSKFKVEQFNDKNKREGGVIMEGEIDHSGNVKISNPRWRETWNGSIRGESLSGKVNNNTSFNITGKFAGIEKSVVPFRAGTVLKWKTEAASEGSMVVRKVEGRRFWLSQTNIYNHAAGAVAMEGEIQRDGKCCIRNSKYKEVWLGDVRRGSISGKVNGFCDFVITGDINPVGGGFHDDKNSGSHVKNPQRDNFGKDGKYTYKKPNVESKPVIQKRPEPQKKARKDEPQKPAPKDFWDWLGL